MRLGRGPARRFRNRGAGSRGTLRERRMRSRTASPEPEMTNALVSGAAPMAGLHERRGPEQAKPTAVSAPPDTPKKIRAAADGLRRSLLSVFKQQPQIANREINTNGPGAGRRLSIITDDNANLPSPDQQSFKPDRPYLAQQADAAPSVNCPYAKLQNKLRLHNSTDPRPCHKESNDRDSVSSTITCTTCNSSPTSPRFTFSSFMKTSSLSFLKFENTVNSRPWRGSGWSVWFRQEDSKDRTSRTETQEK